uniref:Hym-323 protein n=1 Tax=Hydra vulgaris TaxID=6087 RepID=Q9GV34_HYDVU|nr:hym-323 [Hydra vulgaris]
MVAYWRQAGLNYLQFSRIASNTLRKCLKPEYQTETIMKPSSGLKLTKWVQGKPTGEVKQIKF